MPDGQQVVLSGDSHVAGGQLEGREGELQVVVEPSALLTCDIGIVVGSGARIDLQGSLAAATVDLAGGSLFGDGSVVGNVENAGHLSPGESIGVLEVEGDYWQDSNGILRIDIVGRDPDHRV